MLKIHNVYFMMYNLYQIEIDSLNDEDYSMFLAYGDTFPNQTTMPLGRGGDLVWEEKTTRINEVLGSEELCLSECIWNRKHRVSFTPSY